MLPQRERESAPWPAHVDKRMEAVYWDGGDKDTVLGRYTFILPQKKKKSKPQPPLSTEGRVGVGEGRKGVGVEMEEGWEEESGKGRVRVRLISGLLRCGLF